MLINFKVIIKAFYNVANIEWDYYSKYIIVTFYFTTLPVQFIKLKNLINILNNIHVLRYNDKL